MSGVEFPALVSVWATMSKEEVVEFARRLHESRAEALTLLEITNLRLADARPIGGPDDAMLTAEIAATLKRAGR